MARRPSARQLASMAERSMVRMPPASGAGGPMATSGRPGSGAGSCWGSVSAIDIGEGLAARTPLVYDGQDACWHPPATVKSFVAVNWCKYSMMKRSGVVLVAAFSIGLMVAAVHHSPTHAQSADLVLCDRLAADLADPDKPK